MLLLRLLKHSRSEGVPGLFSWSASPGSPQIREENLSSVESKNWAGYLRTERSRKPLFRVTRPGSEPLHLGPNAYLALVNSHSHFLGSLSPCCISGE